MSAKIDPSKTQACVELAQRDVIRRADPSDLCWALNTSTDTLRRLRDGAPGAVWHQALLWRLVSYERENLHTGALADVVTAELAAVPRGSFAAAVTDLGESLPRLLEFGYRASEAIRDKTISPMERAELLMLLPNALELLKRVERDLQPGVA